MKIAGIHMFGTDSTNAWVRIIYEVAKSYHLSNHLASASASTISKVWLSISTKYPCQQRPGISNFGIATCPPLSVISTVSSKPATYIEQTLEAFRRAGI